MDEKLIRHNGIIEEIGYFFCGRYNRGQVSVTFKNSGGTCCFSLEDCDIRPLFDFCGVDCENETNIANLKGKPLCGWFNKESRIVGFSSFIDDQGHDMVRL